MDPNETHEGAAQQQDGAKNIEGGDGNGAEAGKDGQGNDVTSTTDDDKVVVDDLIQGWQEDRARLSELERENFELKEKTAKLTANDDDDDDLTMEEKVEREIKRREEANKTATERDRMAAEREVSFMRRSSPDFRKNEKEILQRAIDRHMNLSEATKDFVGERDRLKKLASETDEQRKKAAGDTTAGKGNGGSIAKGGYDPKTDKNKSIDELYRESI